MILHDKKLEDLKKSYISWKINDKLEKIRNISDIEKMKMIHMWVKQGVLTLKEFTYLIENAFHLNS